MSALGQKRDEPWIEVLIQLESQGFAVSTGIGMMCSLVMIAA